MEERKSEDNGRQERESLRANCRRRRRSWDGWLAYRLAGSGMCRHARLMKYLGMDGGIQRQGQKYCRKFRCRRTS